MRIQPSVAAYVRGTALTLLLAGSIYQPAAAIGAVLAVPLVVWEFRRSIPGVPRVLPFALPLFALLALPGWLNEPVDSYGRDKLTDLVTLTLLAALAASLLRDPAHVLAFARIWLGSGTALAVAELVGLTFDLGFRPGAGAASIVGSALVALVWLAAHRRIWWEAVVAAGSLLSVGLLASGHRAVLAAGLTGAALMGAATTARRAVRVTALMMAALSAAAVVAWTPPLSAANWPVLAHHPLGVGWGNWSQYTGIWGVRHPHDLWLEIAIEAGWLPAAIVVAALGWVLVRLWRAARGEPAAGVVLGLLVGEAVAASASGNTRTFWALLAAGWLVSGWVRPPEIAETEVKGDLLDAAAAPDATR